MMNYFIVGATCLALAGTGCAPKQGPVETQKSATAIAPKGDDNEPVGNGKPGADDRTESKVAPEAPPPIEAIKARVTDKNIVISGRVMFEPDNAVLKAASYPLLDEVATVLVSHPEIVVLSIAGHTDSDGDAGYNKRLSQKRANSVRAYLIKVGIARDRLRARGYGEEIPVASNDNAAGKLKNRRVAFDILERAKPQAVTWRVGTGNPHVRRRREGTDRETEAAVKSDGKDF